MCKHELALLLLLAEYIDEYNPGDTTDASALYMMKSYQKQHQKKVYGEIQAEKEDLRLEPRLERTEWGLDLSFRAGTQKLFVVKDLNTFVKNVEAGQIQKFGTRTEIDYSVHKVCPESKKYYTFIKRIIRDEQLRYEVRDAYDYDARETAGRIRLYGRKMDEIFEMMQEDSLAVPYQDKLYGTKSFLTAKIQTPEVQLKLTGQYENQIFKGIRVSGKLPQIIKGDKYFYYIEDTNLCRMDTEKAQMLMPLFELAGSGSIDFEIGRKSLPQFYYHTMPMLSGYVDFVEEYKEDLTDYLPPQAAFQFYLDVEQEKFVCAAKAVYGEEIFSLTERMEKKVTQPSLRDANAEQEALFHVKRYFQDVDEKNGNFYCKSDEGAYAIMESGISELMAVGEVFCTDRVKQIRFRKKVPMTVGVSLKSGVMELEVSSDEISNKELLEILQSYRKKKRYHRLANGDFVNTNDENFSMLASMLDTLHTPTKEFLKGKIQVPAYRALYLDKILEKNEALYVDRDRNFKSLIKEFKTMEDSDFEVPESLQKIMRPYQVTGFRWLKTLETYGFGGILADDMGLGKTLQIISVLLYAKAEKKDGTSIVISPASLIYNWQEEFVRFAPSLKTLVINGTQTERKALLDNYQQYDVIITSYDLLRRDIGEYEGKQFLYQIIDEAQYIKNHTTIAAKAVKCIQSTVKYALTGTPIENRLSELWSIFDYLMPGFLYGYDTFRKELETPIAKNKEEEATNRLKRMVSPFILRRLKQDVLKDLPDKLEEVQYARFDAVQQKLYDGQVVHMKEMLKKQDEEDFSKNKIQILAELTKLRQICCDPSLLFENYKGESAKKAMCVECIKQAIEGEHRILVFSQFTSMLAMLEEDLTAEGISFYKITGSTKKEERIRLVKQFNEGDVPVFLISLKAGGTGLNLTGADTVIHYDPWWNQAVQNQATDRAHRIGQEKIVTVYKMIMKNTIEEKIIKLQEEKKNLADEILSGEMGGLAQMSRDDLLALL